ncbi:hypothetical protein GDO81_021062 [Engystomops pustulosus]|uniref:Secreted protein n=1 Tax=Engystomops pustulosus TaxID=76066 RepID=A0AAV6YZ59_ENGPU|nr:hypothetical protein GDO81_021062 [Engystomops pustulosus]
MLPAVVSLRWAPLGGCVQGCGPVSLIVLAAGIDDPLLCPRSIRCRCPFTCFFSLLLFPHSHLLLPSCPNPNHTLPPHPRLVSQSSLQGSALS